MRVVQGLTRITEDERVYGVAFRESPLATPLAAGTLPPAMRCADLAAFTDQPGRILTSPQGALLMSVRALEVDGRTAGELVLVFADAVVKASAPDPIVLIQDYHLGLLPRMVQEPLPAATIITFWHIS